MNLSQTASSLAAPVPASRDLPPAVTFLGFGAIAAVVASATAVASVQLGLAPWVMFVGWIAFFTRPTSTGQAFRTGLCVLGGLVFGASAVLALQALTPGLGGLALFAVVFVVTMVVVSMRAVAMLNNIPAWFLGLVAFFAAHQEPAVSAVLQLASAAALGLVAGWGSQQLQRGLTPAR